MISIKRRSKKTDRLRKVLHYLLAMILLIPILANGGTASAASGWSLIDGGGANGLNVNPANRGNTLEQLYGMARFTLLGKKESFQAHLAIKLESRSIMERAG